MADLIADILAQGIQRGLIPTKTRDAINWYRAKVYSIKKANPEDLLKETSRQIGNMDDIDSLAAKAIMPGSMYLWRYPDPIHKKTLPYWDSYPLVFPWRVQGDYIWGLNLHYLDLKFRALLMDSLLQLRSDSRYDQKTMLKLSWQILKKASTNWYMQPTVHCYHTKHIKGKPVLVFPIEWQIAAFLPFQKFKSQTQSVTSSKVWQDSIKSISNTL